MTTAVRETPIPATKSKNWWRPVALLAVVVLVLVLAKVLGADRMFAAVQGWIKGLGPWGPAVFVLIYIAATVAAIPGSAMTIIAGALFGTLVGTIAVSIASTTGAALCFLIARYFARDSVAEWLGKSEKFQKLDRMSEEHGETIVAITRLIPLFPFNLLNYGLGLTRVRFWTYVFYSWLCMLPSTVLFVAGTDAVARLFKEGKVQPEIVVAIAIMAVILTLLIRSAKKKLQAPAPAGSEGEHE